MGGVRCQDVDVAPILQDSFTSNVGVRPEAINPEAAGQLWTLSEELTGAKIQILKDTRIDSRCAGTSHIRLPCHHCQVRRGARGVQSVICAPLKGVQPETVRKRTRQKSRITSPKRSQCAAVRLFDTSRVPLGKGGRTFRTSGLHPIARAWPEFAHTIAGIRYLALLQR
jgi:hypothetical protein